MSKTQHVPLMSRILDGTVADPHAQIELEVAAWHAAGNTEPIGSLTHGPQLHDFLGMTWSEYKRWVSDPKALTAIIDERRARAGADTTRVEIGSTMEAYCPVNWGAAYGGTDSDDHLWVEQDEQRVRKDIWIYHDGIYHAFVCEGAPEQGPWRSRCGNHTTWTLETKIPGAPRCAACEETSNDPRRPQWEGTLAWQTTRDRHPSKCLSCLPKAPPLSRERELPSHRYAMTFRIGSAERRRHAHPLIDKTKGGGPARIMGTRIPVWLLWAWHGMGLRDEQILAMYPSLEHEAISAAYAYVADHPDEIQAEVDAADFDGVQPTVREQKIIDAFENAYDECSDATGIRRADLDAEDVRAWLRCGRSKHVEPHLYIPQDEHAVPARLGIGASGLLIMRCTACGHSYRASEPRNARRICPELSGQRQARTRSS